MAMRLSGLMSGMDTESLIQQLVEARKTKVNAVKKKQITANYKQEAWKDLNTKLKNLQAKYVSNLRFSSSFMKKTTKVSNSSAVSVITGDNAVNGVQSLEINKLAKTGYLTGRQLSTDSQYTAMTKLSDLDTGDGTKFSGTGSFTVQSANGKVDVQVNADTTISDVLTQLKDAGLNANFDAKNQRFFISAKESGLKNDFSITASGEGGQNALKALGLQVNLNEDAATLKQYQTMAAYTDGTATDAEIKSNMASLASKTVEDRVADYQKRYTALMESRAAAQKKIEDLTTKYRDTALEPSTNYASQIEAKKESIKTIQESIDSGTLTDSEKSAAEASLATMKDDLKDLEERRSVAIQKEEIAKIDTEIESFVAEGARDGYVTITSDTVDGKTVYTATATQQLTDEVADDLLAKAKYAKQVMDEYEAAGGAANKTATGATKVTAQDAEITLNGAKFYNTTNSFEINGLTFTALNETKEGEIVTVTTADDTDGIYDMIKNFIKEYNSIINEMDKLYNAASVGSMEPLLSEEKAALSETEVDDVEKKLKEAALRRDDTISSVSSGLREVMADGISIGGKTMYLSDFGIDLLGYFTAADNEKNAYHIDGDPDDADTSGKADKLKGLISSDPQLVVDFFTRLGQKLYDKMSDMSRSVDGYRSFGSFYDDKKVKEDYESYNTKIADLEQKLNDYEDSWYKKFSKMETAMAKMQSNANAITGLLGGGK